MRLIKFGVTNLEHFNQVEDIGSGETPTSYDSLPDGGAIDNYGSAQKHPGVVSISKRMRLRSTTAAGLEAIFLGLKALRGTKDKLYQRTLTGDIRWVWARLKNVIAQRSYETSRFKWIQDVELQFEWSDPSWRGRFGSIWYLNSGVLLNTGYLLGSNMNFALPASPTSLSIALGAAADPGRAPVRSMQIVVLAGNAEMSAITIARTGGESLTYSGAIPSGGQLVIDTGAMAVTCTGATDPYNNLVFAPTADMAAWFALEPGANEITVTFTGGGTGKQIEFIFYEAWY